MQFFLWQGQTRVARVVTPSRTPPMPGSGGGGVLELETKAVVLRECSQMRMAGRWFTGPPSSLADPTTSDRGADTGAPEFACVPAEPLPPDRALEVRAENGALASSVMLNLMRAPLESVDPTEQGSSVSETWIVLWA